MGMQVECDTCNKILKQGDTVMSMTKQKVGALSIFAPIDSITILICESCYKLITNQGEKK